MAANQMSMNFNGEVLTEAPEALGNRAMMYGDGLFETIRMFENHLPFLPLHWERLNRGLQVLGMTPPADWSVGFFEGEIRKIIQGNARIRLSVWRAPGGLFYPLDNTVQYLITASPLESSVFNWQENGLNVQLSERVRLPMDSLSGLKTLGATRYVAAAMEARARGLDDVIVLNERDRVSEASSSNVLWIKNGSVFSPPATDGQISGTFNKLLCEVLAVSGIQVREKPCTFAELLAADEVFLTNAIQGIRWIQFLEGTEFTCENSFHFNKLTVKYLLEKTDRISP